MRFEYEIGPDEYVAAAGTVFMFGKKYLTDPQLQELRRLAGLV